MAQRQYGRTHQALRVELLRGDPPCAHCGIRLATVADHDPPVSSFPHPDLWVGRMIPSCATCSAQQGGRVKAARAAQRRRPVPVPSRRW